MVNLLDIDKHKFAHKVRTSIRGELWDELRYRRPRFNGAEVVGFDKDLSTHLYRSGKLRGIDKYRLRCILSGAVSTQRRLADKFPGAESPICRCCNLGVEETTEHLFLHCPAHSAPRSADLREEYFQNLPPCAKLQGILPLNWPVPPDLGEGRDSQLACAQN